MRKSRTSINTFTPHDITLRDDAMHNIKGFHIETFYFDAMFDNLYSIASTVNVITVGCFRLVLTGMFIYKDSKLIRSRREKILYHHLVGSEQYPYISIHNRDIIRLLTNKNTRPWVYAISMGDNQEGFDLRFLQKTSAWNGKTSLGDWLVLPRFEVQGALHLDGQTIPVQGRGYHDHNIFPFLAPFKIGGWHFGKIVVDAVTIAWARIIKRNSNEQLIAVVNTGQTYMNIPPNDICYTIQKQIRSSGKLIPETYRLTIQSDSLSLDVSMKTLDSHLIRMPLFHYWRSHVHIKGTLQIGSRTKNIDDIEITELLQFL